MDSLGPHAFLLFKELKCYLCFYFAPFDQIFLQIHELFSGGVICYAVVHGRISTTVPIGTSFTISSISLLVTAIQPFVQSNHLWQPPIHPKPSLIP